MHKHIALAIIWLWTTGPLHAAPAAVPAPVAPAAPIAPPVPVTAVTRTYDGCDARAVTMAGSGQLAENSAAALKSYFSQVSGRWPPTSDLKYCTQQLRAALQEANSPEIARAGGSELLEAARKLTAVVAATPERVGLDPLNTIAVKEVTRLGTELIAREQRIDPTSARYDFYAGPSSSLMPDGSWKNGAEILFRSNTDKFWQSKDAPDRKDPKMDNYWQVSSLFAYRDRGGDQEVELNPEQPAQPTPGAEIPGFVSPFEAKGGVASVDLRLARHFSETAAMAVLGGAESLPTEEEDSTLTTLKLRAGLGGLYRTSYGDGALGELFLGYIHDSRFKAELTGEDQDSTERLALSGILQLPSFNEGKSLRLAARIFASVPITGGDSSELRLSVLLAYDLRTIFSKI